MKNEALKLITLNALAAESGSDSRHIRRWLTLEGVHAVQQGSRDVYPRAAALAVIADHQNPLRHGEEGSGGPGLAELATVCANQCEKYHSLTEILHQGLCALHDAALDEKFIFASEADAKTFLELINAPWKRIKEQIPSDELALIEAETANENTKRKSKNGKQN